jgi:hypothetical protein
MIFRDRRNLHGTCIYLLSPGDKMNETPQQYTQRILDYIDGKEPLAVQAATAKKLERLIKKLSTAKLRKRPAPEWEF